MKRCFLMPIAVLLSLLSGCSGVVMPSPGGQFPVGTTSLSLVDNARLESHEPGTGHPRRILLQAWYPAEPGSQATHDFYIDSGLAQALEHFMGMPGFLFGSPQASHSAINAAISAEREQYPVILFNHGYGSYEKQNYSQMEELASQGFIVLSLNHPYDSVLSRFPDGSVVSRADSPYWKLMAELQKNMDSAGRDLTGLIHPINQATDLADKESRLFRLSTSQFYALIRSDFETWVEDSLFVIASLDQINRENPVLGSHMDAANVGIYGHSFGGSVAGEVALRRPDAIRAGINLDGPQFIFDQSRHASLRVPFLFAYSTSSAYGKYICDQRGMNDSFYLQSRAPAATLVLQGAAHHNFSDLTYIGFLKNTGTLGPIDNVQAGQIATAFISTFFQHYLYHKAGADLENLARKYTAAILQTRHPEINP